jgi:site-specific DNA-methyltransferase (adenine-specific)
MKVTDKITITNEDNMALMARYPDNYFDLAIVDPPYGIGASSKNFIRQGKQTGKSMAVSGLKYTSKDWDCEVPNKIYFDELQRVSKNQIVWGGNYFASSLPNSSCWLIWDKVTGDNLYADAELAWTSFDKAVRKFTWMWKGMFQQNMSNKEERIHPTQKPVALYKWILENYAEKGSKILDTHLGSGSIAIACHDYGFELTACELDREYYDKAIERIQNHTAQTKLFL